MGDVAEEFHFFSESAKHNIIVLLIKQRSTKDILQFMGLCIWFKVYSQIFAIHLFI